MSKAAIYMRSSKDRKDVSIDTQRRDLEQLAVSKALEITKEFVDVVESGKDDQRPGYQAMLKELANRSRGWDHLLILDTSRLARREHIASVFHHECKKRGVKILYVRVPEMDPINELIVLSVMRAMDEIHSRTSREKGNAGMAENVRKGFRAGGRAPLGYALKHVDIGLVREGRPVLKSSLEVSDQADQVKRYLQLRCAGVPRAAALKQSALKISASTAIGMEWNALTYAGCTVWNVHSEYTADGYQGGNKRRKRDDWILKEGTHQALISREEAELLLDRLQNSDIGRAVSLAKRAMSDYVLTGVLVAPDGSAWRGMRDRNGQSYRLAAGDGRRGRTVRAAPLEERILAHVAEELASGGLAVNLHENLQTRDVDRSRRKQAQAELTALTAKIDRAVEAALYVEDPDPIYRKIDALERDRKSRIKEIEQLRRDEELQLATNAVSLESIRGMLAGLAEDLRTAEPQHRKAVLELLIEKIVLDPATNQVDLHYRVAAAAAGDCVNMASPRGRAGYAVLRALQKLAA